MKHSVWLDLLVIGVIGFAAVQPVAAQTTALRMNSDAGDYIGQGTTKTLTPANGTFTGSKNFGNGVTIDFSGPSSNWHLDFVAPNGALLAVGSYENAERFPFQTPTRPGLSVSGEGRGCNTLTGRFDVVEVVFSGNNVVSFAASFEQHCEGAVPALYGSIIFNTATTPTFTVTINRLGSGTGTVTSFPTGISCGADCDEPFVIGTVVTLTATPDPGYSFSGWGGPADCTEGVIKQSVNVTCTATFLATPLIPSDLRAEVTGNAVRLTWNLPIDSPAVSSYRIEVGSTSGMSDLGSFDIGGDIRAAVAVSVPTGIYYVRVRAANVFGLSAASNEVIVRVPSGLCLGPPSAPTALGSTVLDDVVTLTWSQLGDVATVTSYSIEAGSASGLANLAIFTTPQGPVSVRAASRTYFVRVRAHNMCGVSAPSNEIVVIVP